MVPVYPGAALFLRVVEYADRRNILPSEAWEIYWESHRDFAISEAYQIFKAEVAEKARKEAEAKQKK